MTQGSHTTELRVENEFVGQVVGTGGAVMRGVTEETGAILKIDQSVMDVVGYAVVTVSGETVESVRAAKRIVEMILERARATKKDKEDKLKKARDVLNTDGDMGFVAIPSSDASGSEALTLPIGNGGMVDPTGGEHKSPVLTPPAVAAVRPSSGDGPPRVTAGGTMRVDQVGPTKIRKRSRESGEYSGEGSPGGWQRAQPMHSSMPTDWSLVPIKDHFDIPAHLMGLAIGRGAQHINAMRDHARTFQCTVWMEQDSVENRGFASLHVGGYSAEYVKQIKMHCQQQVAHYVQEANARGLPAPALYRYKGAGKDGGNSNSNRRSGNSHASDHFVSFNYNNNNTRSPTYHGQSGHYSNSPNRGGNMGPYARVPGY